jgi:hypothetical protein
MYARLRATVLAVAEQLLASGVAGAAIPHFGVDRFCRRFFRLTLLVVAAKVH